MRERGLSYDYVRETVKTPEKSFAGKERGTTESIRYFGNSKVTIVSKKNNSSEVVVLSAWIDPPLKGTKDAKKRERYEKYQKAGFWGKLFIILKQQIGL